MDKKGYRKKQYRSSAKGCAHCPHRTTCTGGRADYKKIEETVNNPLYAQIHQRLPTPYAGKMKKLRQANAESVAGTLINFMGLQRVWTREFKTPTSPMPGAAAAYNLKKWLNYGEKRRKTAVETLCIFDVAADSHQDNCCNQHRFFMNRLKKKNRFKKPGRPTLK